jgi:hypothetical protein
MSFLICFLLATSSEVQSAVKRAAESGRVTLLDQREQGRSVPPGKAPVLSFRYMEGASKHRFGDWDLMVDDAGH